MCEATHFAFAYNDINGNPLNMGRKLTQRNSKKTFELHTTIKVSLVKWCNWQTIHTNDKIPEHSKEKNKSGGSC